ncbi:sulfatase-like hydrolase/transferase [Antarcticibacterium sp. 1MA-6-2]|uniref:sulfatase-like hydrolase/transferase n=1 Tax=Antarcticibacterium sp. 1MA-6-2 TaxID=2908210 RepID=UPI001F4011D1|nr:sulfatase-like hydrolase/transferase [Antarcticibacterium sp. 1MA-6-2]UJH92681.1 sulfatase-like hydrolase/transferase [Antarcticibacterium sp. 1MA-6-2]
MEAKEEHLEKFKNHPRQILAAMTWSLDENVGKLTRKLDEFGIRDNTLIYFLSDNGGAHNNSSSSGPLKGWKGNEFEGGHRVPFVVSWPPEIEANQTFNGLSSSLDIFKTSLAAAKIESKSDMILDGKNLLPYLKNQKQGNPHKELYWKKLDESAARLNNYKLISLNGFGSVLYDLESDLSETIDLSGKDSIKFKEISENYHRWEAELIDPLWREGEEWESVTYHIHKRLMQNKEALYKSPSQNKRYKKKISN